MKVKTKDYMLEEAAEAILKPLTMELGGIRPTNYIKARPDGPYLIIEFASPAEHHYKMHNKIVNNLHEDNPFKDRSTVQKRKSAPKERLLLPETQLLKNEIAGSLTIDKNSFDDNFFARYMPSVSGFEQQITANANYVVYGRRGAGKSSLLAFGLHTALRDGHPISWVAMQPYANRSDTQVVPAVISEVLNELNPTFETGSDMKELIESYDKIAEDDGDDVLIRCERLIPRTRRAVGKLATSKQPLTIFLDDIHVIAESIQPLVLGFVYKITRGNNSYIKASGIAQLTRLWDGTTQRWGCRRRMTLNC